MNLDNTRLSKWLIRTLWGIICTLIGLIGYFVTDAYEAIWTNQNRSQDNQLKIMQIKENMQNYNKNIYKKLDEIYDLSKQGVAAAAENKTRIKGNAATIEDMKLFLKERARNTQGASWIKTTK